MYENFSNNVAHSTLFLCLIGYFSKQITNGRIARVRIIQGSEMSIFEKNEYLCTIDAELRS